MMETPFQPYGFKCRSQGSGVSFRYVVYGDPAHPGRYLVKGRPIVSKYNAVKYPRDGDELDLMRRINAAYHNKRFGQLKSLIGETRKKYARGPHGTVEMWKSVLDQYETALPTR